VRRLTIISAPYAQAGFFPQMLPQQAAVGAAMAEHIVQFYQLLGGGLKMRAGNASTCRATLTRHPVGPGASSGGRFVVGPADSARLMDAASPPR